MTPKEKAVWGCLLAIFVTTMIVVFKGSWDCERHVLQGQTRLGACHSHRDLDVHGDYGRTTLLGQPR